MISAITRVWLKSKADSPWEQIIPSQGISLSDLKKNKKGCSLTLDDLRAKVSDNNSWPDLLNNKIKGLSRALDDLKKTQTALNSTKNREKRILKYPAPGNKYWSVFNQKSAE
jgi:hypothetical protein